LGRRQSIERTTARRFPSARKRPEAGYLPTLASGRPRARMLLSGDPAMTLLRRAPREVYRVYSEEEFFAVGEDALLAGSAASAGLSEPAVSVGAGDRRLRRLAGAAALAGAVGAVGATLAVTDSRPAGGAASRTVTDTDPLLSARARVSTSAVASARPRAGRSPLPVRPSPAAAVAMSQRAPGEHRRAPHVGDMPRERTEGARRYAALTPRAVSDAELARPSAAAIDVARVSAAAVAVTSQPQHAEFGFER
jgi:hypothetical protein